MTSSGEGREASGKGSIRESVSPKPLAARLLPLACSCAALVLTVFGFFEFDAPLTRFVRSLNDFQIDHLRDPWLAHLSDLGDRLGRGESLAVLSVVLLAIGSSLKLSAWKSAGWQTLLAHGLAGLSNNLVKHLVGRARPKFMHEGKLELSPLRGSGWDSFPSGHAMASFAVAMVLVVRFPKARWVIIPVAVAIAASRILRGAHFLTDIAGGAVLGALIGTVVANPWKDWRVSLESALFKLTPVLAGLLVAVWTIGHRASDHWPSPQLIGIGLAITLIALVGHGLPVLKPAFRSSYFTRSLARTLIGLGIGMFTGSVWVATTVLLVCVAFWLRSDVREPDTTAHPCRLWVQEAAFGLAVLLTLYAMFELRGALPLL